MGALAGPQRYFAFKSVKIWPPSHSTLDRPLHAERPKAQRSFAVSAARGLCLASIGCDAGPPEPERDCSRHNPLLSLGSGLFWHVPSPTWDLGAKTSNTYHLFAKLPKLSMKITGLFNCSVVHCLICL